MVRQHYRAFSLFAGTILAGLPLAGCHDPEVNDLVARRQENLSWTLGAFKDVEAHAPGSMAWTVGSFRDHLDQDLDNTSKNPARVGGLVQDDIDRWQRNQPAYNETARQVLQGNPDSIRSTAPKMAW